MTHPPEIKQAAIQRYLDGQPVKLISYDLEISKMALPRWLKAADVKLRRPIRTKKVPDHIKAEAVRRRLAGEGTKSIMADLPVWRWQIIKWIREAEDRQ